MSPLHQKPIIHGRDHMPGHPDPIPGLISSPSGGISEIILATLPGAYYKLPETGTDDWADSSGANRTATWVTRTGEVRGVAAPLDEGDGSLCVTVAGPTPAASLSESHVGICDDSFFEFSGTSDMTVSARVKPVGTLSGTFSWGICGNATTASSAAGAGWGLYVLSPNFDPDSGGIGNKPCFRRQLAAGTMQQAYSPTPLAPSVWVRLTAAFDSTDIHFYVDDTHVDDTASSASLPSGAAYHGFRIGCCGIHEGTGGTFAPFGGEIDSVIVWDRALTPSEIGAIVAGDAGIPGGASSGWVLTSDGSGGTSWAAPTLEVEF